MDDTKRTTQSTDPKQRAAPVQRTADAMGGVLEPPVRTDVSSVVQMMALGAGSLDDQASLLSDRRLAHRANKQRKAAILQYLQRRHGNRYVARMIERINGRGQLAARPAALTIVQCQPEPVTAAVEVPGLPADRVREAQTSLTTNPQAAVNAVVRGLSQRGRVDLSFLEGRGVTYVADRSQIPGGHYGHTSLTPGTGLPRPCRVIVGPDALRTVSVLYSTIMHEYQHVLQNRAGRFEEPLAEVEAHLWEVENLERTGLWRDVREMAELPARLAHWWRRLRPAQRTPPLQTRYDAARAHLAEMNRRRLQEQLRQQTGAVQPMTTQPAGGKEISMDLSSSGEIQAKLTINPPDDVYEREAHRVAEQVMRVPEPRVQRQEGPEEEEEEILRTKPLTGEATLLAQRQVGHAFGDNGHSRVRSPAAELITSSAGLRRPVQRQAGRARPTSPLLPEIWNRLAKWVKHDQPDRPADLTRMPALRGILLALHARVGLALWRHIRQITWVGPRGAMEFHPVDEGALKATLIGRGYTTSYFAKGGTDRWGLREKNVDAAGLHWRGRPGGKVNVHIDLHPPSWTGFWHWLMDSGRIRSMTHTQEAIRAGIASLGIYIPVIHEQRAHGRLTVRLNKLENQARGRPDVQAEVDEGRRHLRQASSIIWTRSVVSQAELDNAIWYLDLAAVCASGAEHSLRSARR